MAGRSSDEVSRQHFCTQRRSVRTKIFKNLTKTNLTFNRSTII